jgi:hypothetical protein
MRANMQVHYWYRTIWNGLQPQLCALQITQVTMLCVACELKEGVEALELNVHTRSIWLFLAICP